MFTVALIGCGQWGPNLARIFHTDNRSRLKYVCDLDESRSGLLARRLRSVTIARDVHQILDDEEIDAIVIATPLVTHYEIVKASLEAGKHVLVEKPLAPEFVQALELTELAKSNNKILMVGYVFLFNPGILKAKECLTTGVLGELRYIQAIRTSLGPIRFDTNALWDLASHDISIMLYCVADNPVFVSGVGGYFTGNPHADIVSASIKFDNGSMGFLYSSWIDPCKVRRATFVGEEKMLLFDDISPFESIKIFDKGVERGDLLDTYGVHRMGIRVGDILLPRLEPIEPLNNECCAFIDACLKSVTNPAIGDLPLRVTAILESIDKSIIQDGAPVEVETDVFN